jgi:hypothetical protein
MSMQSAINCFNENIQLFGNAQVEPEKYNLYRGLGELAHALQSVVNDIEEIKQKVARIERNVR